MLYVIILIAMSMLGALASYCFKLASASLSIIEIIKNKKLYLGILLYVFAALLNIYLLKFLDYSVVLPLTSLSYIWTMFISHKMLGERITRKKIFGVTFIILGAITLGLS